MEPNQNPDQYVQICDSGGATWSVGKLGEDGTVMAIAEMVGPPRGVPTTGARNEWMRQRAIHLAAALNAAPQFIFDPLAEWPFPSGPHEMLSRDASRMQPGR